MNKQILKLSEIAQKPERYIIGLMSGTSLDGLDIVLCKVGEGRISVLHFITVEYRASLRKRISRIQSKQMVDLQEVTILNTELAHLYAEWVLEALQKWGVSKESIDLIASHGQTIYHHPNNSLTSTFQIVDGDHIAQKTGIITISDFRQKHIAAGGQGAPLAELMDERLFRHETKNRVLLNLGGIGNLTWLPSKDSHLQPIATDTGPANTLINAATQKYFDLPFDEAGTLANSGKAHSELVKYLLLEPFFRETIPKTTGQEEFNLELVENLMQSHSISLQPKDLIASLTELTVKSVVRILDTLTKDVEFELYISGGGIHNISILEGLIRDIPNSDIRPFEELGILPDAKEAVLMVFLANECLSGNPFKIAGTQTNLGKISFPG